jgi:hypothetical protein
MGWRCLAKVLLLVAFGEGPFLPTREQLMRAGERFAFPGTRVLLPAPFGNAYEAMGPREMAAYLGEMKGMGFNRYGDWITHDRHLQPYMSAAAGTWARSSWIAKRRPSARRRGWVSGST